VNDGDDSSSMAIAKYRERIVNGPIASTVLRLGAPPLVAQLVTVSYNVADALWLSLYNDLAVATPRQTWPVIMFFQAVINALTAACLAVTSQRIGAGDYEGAGVDASRYLTASLSLGALSCMLLLGLRGFLFSQVIYTPPEILPFVMDYSGVVAFDVMFNSLTLTYSAILQGLGDTKRPSAISTVAMLINVALDPFFVLGLGPFPRLGVVGAALTDVMGKIISLTAQAYIVRRHYSALKLGFTASFDREWASVTSKVGVPIFATGVINSSAFMAQLRLVNIFGYVAATAYSIGFVVVDIVDAALWGLTSGVAVMVGQNLGAGMNDRAKKIALLSVGLVFLLTSLSAAIVYPFRHELVGLFAREESIIDESIRFLDTILPTLAFFGIFATAMSVGRGSGHTLAPTILGAFRLWGLRVGLGYVLAVIEGMGAAGAWLALAISNVIGGLLALAWIYFGRWNRALIRVPRGLPD